jgi:hypothetical protein
MPLRAATIVAPSPQTVTIRQAARISRRRYCQGSKTRADRRGRIKNGILAPGLLVRLIWL